MKIIAAAGFFHDLNFSYLNTDVDGSLISVEEERFSRIKSHKISDPNTKTEYLSLKYIESCINHSLTEIDKLIISDLIAPKCLDSLRSLMPNADVISIGHHISHAYNIIATNNISSTACVLVLDGYGDNLSGISGYWRDSKFDIINEFSADNSLGLLYSSATQHLGLGGFGSEGKLQGLASYGNYSSRFSIRSEINISSSSLQLSKELIAKDEFADQELYAINALRKNVFFSNLLPRRFSDEPIERSHADFANTIQSDIFNVINNLADSINIYGYDTLVISGGIAQNSSLINHLYLNSTYSRILTSTSCSDRGNSLGALAAYLNKIGKSLSVEDPLLGFQSCPDADNSPHGIDFEEIATLLSQNKVIGIVEGCAELGARALGNRSIIASPLLPEMKDILNKRVKHRESFRPFAPVMQKSLVDKYFDASGINDHPYMTKCFNAKQSTKDMYPSAVHADNTSRLQILGDLDQKRLIFGISSAASELHGIDLILNTSFNDNGMPIVNNKDDALMCAKATNLDYLILEGKLIKP